MKRKLFISLLAVMVSSAAFGATFFNYNAHNIYGDGGTITNFVIPLDNVQAENAWRIVYSNALSVMSELPFGTSGTCLKSTGTSSVPEWGTCGSGIGDGTTVPWVNVTNTGGVTTTELTYLHGITSSIQTQLDTKITTLDNKTMDNTIITGGAIDNTVIGGGIAHSITATFLTSTGPTTFQAGASIESDQSLDFSHYGCSYNSTTYQLVCATDNGASSGDTYPMYAFRAGVSTALDNGQEVFAVQDNTTSLWKITKEGNVTQTGTLTASQIITTCAAADNNCTVNAANDGPPGDPVDGDCYYAKATDQWLCYNGATWAASAATSVHWDNVTNKAALPQVKDFVIKGYAVGDNNLLLWKADQAQTLTRMDCITGGADNVTITLMECDSSGASCSTTDLVVAATSSGVTDSSTSAVIDAGDWVRVLVETIQGTPTHVSCTARYTVAMP